MGPADQYPEPFLCLRNAQDINLHPLRKAQVFLRHDFLLGKLCIRFSQIDADGISHLPLHDTRDHLPDLIFIQIVNGTLLFLPDLLQDHILCFSGCDPSELRRVHFQSDHIPGNNPGSDLLRFLLGYLQGVVLDIVIRLHDLFLIKTMEISRLPVHFHHHILVSAEVFLAGRLQRILDRRKQNILADLLLLLQHIKCL